MKYDEEICAREFPAFARVLSTHNFRILRSTYDEASFGNTEVYASSPEFRLRLTKDRGDIAVAVAPLHTPSWYPLQDVLAFLEGRKLDYREVDIQNLVHVLDGNYAVIKDVLGDVERLSKLESLEKEKEGGLLNELFGKNRRTN